MFEKLAASLLSAEALRMQSGHYVEAKDLDSFAALVAAEGTRMCKYKGERDTEFVKRIVAAYLNAKYEIDTGARQRSG